MRLDHRQERVGPEENIERMLDGDEAVAPGKRRGAVGEIRAPAEAADHARRAQAGEQVEHRLGPLDGKRIEMQEHEVDPVAAEPPPRGVDRVAKPLGLEVLAEELSRIGVDADADLGRDAHLRVPGEGAAEQRLRMPGAVGLRRVEQADAGRHAFADRRERDRIVGLAPADGVIAGKKRPADGPGAEPQGRNGLSRPICAGDHRGPLSKKSVPEGPPADLTSRPGRLQCRRPGTRRPGARRLRSAGG